MVEIVLYIYDWLFCAQMGRKYTIARGSKVANFFADPQMPPKSPQMSKSRPQVPNGSPSRTFKTGPKSHRSPASGSGAGSGAGAGVGVGSSSSLGKRKSSSLVSEIEVERVNQQLRRRNKGKSARDMPLTASQQQELEGLRRAYRERQTAITRTHIDDLLRRRVSLQLALEEQRSKLREQELEVRQRGEARRQKQREEAKDDEEEDEEEEEEEKANSQGSKPTSRADPTKAASPPARRRTRSQGK